MFSFAKTLLAWHQKNPRPLPWSGRTRDPYPIWLSEVIMQQTRIEQGSSYYISFIEKYPDVQALANAPVDEVLHLWEGLGYYTRARNMHRAAKIIVEDLKGQFPTTYEGLLSLPGIGPYSAAAIASFAYGQKHAVVDGNVKRVLSRFNGIRSSIDTPAIHKRIHQLAQDLIADALPDLFNQAIMNFGALVCKPVPDCVKCPFTKECYAFKNGLTNKLPVRTKKNENKDRYFHFIFIHYRDRFLMFRRNGKDIWHSLYTPPHIEARSLRAPAAQRILSSIEEWTGQSQSTLLPSGGTCKQKLSHQNIHAKFHHVQLLKKPRKTTDHFIWVDKKSSAHLAKPKMIVEKIKEMGVSR